jgi:shikimate kinase
MGKWISREMNIVLIGYRCSGKTVVGKILASELGKAFLDTDALIEERSGRSIETMISTKGWDPFRETEKRLVEEVSRKNNLVIATGGGIVMEEENVKNLKQNGWVVWLKGKPEVLKERMAKEQEVLNAREPFYERAGDLVVDTSNLSIRDAADLIIENLPK